MKKLVFLIFSIVFLFGLVTPISASASSVSIIIDGKEQTYDQPAIIDNGSTLVPMRGIFESLNASIGWDQETKTVTGEKGDISVQLTLGNKKALVNGQAVELHVPAKVLNGRTLVPLRFISESLGAKVGWDQETKTVTIKSGDAVVTPAPKKKLTTSELVKKVDEQVVTVETDITYGSGVIVGDGLILTNAHVLEGYTNGYVGFTNGAKVGITGIVEINKEKDLALIKLDTSMGINPVSFGSFEDVGKGDDAVAIGSPYGLKNTVSTGIISNVYNEDGFRLIQTSAQIEAGSSGGGLFNMYGELVGINTFAIDSSGDLNFAIAIDEALDWKKYFTMNHSNIPVKEKSERFTLWNGISFGMTMDEVKELETTPFHEEGNIIAFPFAEFYDYPVHIEYTFSTEGYLQEVGIYFIEGVTDLTKQQLTERYNDIYSQLREDIGFDPIDSLEGWTESGNYEEAIYDYWYGQYPWVFLVAGYNVDDKANQLNITISIEDSQ
ncbi:trypsin-like serine protease [Filobacillus milosensis]|uniref:Trypsin-like serine protease n=1 Tax=Filobacillus milosensis TaxID=94137 RepID=A0A4Y8IU61_9BACI|nr:stalk domain-containing protein [Filobacillus milosensis]TFB24466.1 trypsin-like serine protease [Filobacillus milosensis]